MMRTIANSKFQSKEKSKKLRCQIKIKPKKFRVPGSRISCRIPYLRGMLAASYQLQTEKPCQGLWG